jgi:ActR/RegA family two-component response regulator
MHNSRKQFRVRIGCAPMGHSGSWGCPSELVEKAEKAMSSSNDVLIVEDDLMLARALQRSLVSKGIAARHVARCSTAAGLLGPFVVGVFDIDLPDGDGVELAHQMVREGIVNQVVFYTACSHPARLARARALGTVFVKSSHLSSLMDVLVSRPSRDPVLEASSLH